MHVAEAIQHLKKVLPYIHTIEPIGKNLFTVKYASYNGIRSWRCPTCFAEHRKRIADLKN